MPIPFTGVPEFGDGLLASTTSRSFLSRNANGTVGLFDASSILSGTGTVNRIPKFTASGVLGNSLMIDNGSNVTVDSQLRVGTTLLVNSNSIGRNFEFTSLGNFIIRGAASGGWVVGLNFQASDTTALGGFGAFGTNQALTYMWIGQSFTSTGLAIDTNNNVGVGTTTFTGERLRVNGLLRVDTVDNATGDILTWNSITGRLTRRTISQTLSDIGGWGVSGNAPTVDTTFLGTTNARPFDIRVNNIIVGNFAVGGAVNFGSPSSSSSVLNIGGGASIFAQGTITAPGITEDSTAATNYLTLGGSNVIRRRNITQVKSDLGIFDSIHNQTATYQSANFRISGLGRFGSSSSYSELGASSLFSNVNFSIRTPRLYVSNNDITGDLSGLTWRVIVDSGTATGEGLYIKGRILSTNNVSASSDRRLKKNISRLNNADILSCIEGKTYLFGGKQTAGFIAQDVQKYLPHLVNKESNGFFSMDYVGLIPYIVEFIKSDREKIKELEKEVQRLKILINAT